MPLWEIRRNCEYIHQVEADTEEEALSKASAIPESEWLEISWSKAEAEPIESSEDEEVHDLTGINSDRRYTIDPDNV